jgi:nucleotide-binding universal stress UspA family protein
VLQRQVAPQFTPEQVDRFASEELDRFIEMTAGEAAGRVRRKVRTGNTREEIEAELAESGADLVVLGTHGLGGFDRLVIGSVASDVVRHAPCSVLVVPPAATRTSSHGEKMG